MADRLFLALRTVKSMLANLHIQIAKSRMKPLKSSAQGPHRILVGVALVALLHCALWFAFYNQTALGESPALDNRQTLALAHAMAEGSLAEESFHRAPAYPYLLSLFLSLGLPYELLPLLARWLNAAALALTASATALVALRAWGRPACAWLAGLLVALNPVLLFFAGDAFDRPAHCCRRGPSDLVEAAYSGTDLRNWPLTCPGGGLAFAHPAHRHHLAGRSLLPGPSAAVPPRIALGTAGPDQFSSAGPGQLASCR
jgi:hypothetical protein